jgi:hypothetical protein
MALVLVKAAWLTLSTYFCRFVQRAHLEAHLRTHTGARPYKCDLEGCGQSFTTGRMRDALLSAEFLLFIYLLVGISKVKCHACASTGSALTRHVRCHNEEKRYLCEERCCGKKFARLEGLRMHMKAHSKEYGYGGTGKNGKHKKTRFYIGQFASRDCVLYSLRITSDHAHIG